MKTLIKTAVAAAMCAAFFAGCTSVPAVPEKDGVITVTVPQGTRLMVRVKTADGSPVHIRGADKTVIPGTDEVRELKEEKPMQILSAADTLIKFTGNITEFDIKDNGTVESIGTSGCPQLEVLYCAGNKISSLQLSANKALKRLQCYNNRLPALDVSQQSRMELLWCGINRLNALDVSGCTNLTQLRCYLNGIDSAAMDALLRSLPAENATKVSVREARILAPADTMKNGIPSEAAVKAAEERGWRILTSADVSVYP